MTPGRALDDEQVRKIGERDAAMRVAYDRVPTSFPAHAQPDDGSAAPLDANAAFRKRLLYRSKQRGWCVGERGRERGSGSAE
jgi:hypothetical protein